MVEGGEVEGEVEVWKCVEVGGNLGRKKRNKGKGKMEKKL